MFEMKTCPYCAEARRLIALFLEKNPCYREVKINYIDEESERALANSHDYYFVPAFYVNSKKMHEGPIDMGKVKKVFEAAFIKP